MALEDYYQLLGLKPNATQNEIRQAYHQLIRLHHPDKTSTVSSGQASKLNSAWEVLGNETSRREYDQVRAKQFGEPNHMVQIRTKAADRPVDNLSPVDAKLSSQPQSFALKLDLSDFTTIETTTSEVSRNNGTDAPNQVSIKYVHPCRCSGSFVITEKELEQGIALISCDGCSERCKVEYEMVEE